MSTKVAACVGVVCLLAAGLANADVFSMDGTYDPVNGTGLASLRFVTVGDAGNPADTTGYGAVAYTYQMGKYDVTAAQYCAFLNAVASTGDPYGLYNTGMAPAYNFPSFGGSPTFGITQSGSSGSYTYSVVGNPNFPMNCTSWANAARFCNWLSNRQPTGAEGSGTTETGSYTPSGKTSSADLTTITRNAGATYVIPTEDEWYKAAYYKGGTNAGYLLYPTQNNSTPSNLLDPAGTNNANFCYDYRYGSYTDPTNWLTVVGAFASSPGAYGTFDMGGDVWQWNEGNIGSYRGVRGGSFVWSYDRLQASYRNSFDPTYEDLSIGFRVAQVPEPASMALVALGVVRMLRRRGARG